MTDPTPPSRRAAREAQAQGSEEKVLTPFEQLLAAPEPKRKKPRKKKRRGRLVGLAVVLVVLLGVGAGGVYVWNTFGTQIMDKLGWGESKDFPPGQAQGEAIVTIRDGDGGQAISQGLYAAGVTKTPEVFYTHLLSLKSAPTFYPGSYKLQQRMTAADALAMLQDPARKLENTVTIREGDTLSTILDTTSQQLKIPRADLEAAVKDPSAYSVSASSLEGWLFPATYTFEPGTTATQVIQRYVDRMDQALGEAGIAGPDRQRILTIASIVEREGRTSDFPKVARVILNRLDQGMMLQMDSTAQYGYGELHSGSVSTSADAQHDDNPWNTYVHTGLPKGPIASPGDAAIAAAAHPAAGPWLYFVTVNQDTGETIFTTNYEDHLRYVKQFQEWCAANDDRGC